MAVPIDILLCFVCEMFRRQAEVVRETSLLIFKHLLVEIIIQKESCDSDEILRRFDISLFFEISNVRINQLLNVNMSMLDARQEPIWKKLRWGCSNNMFYENIMIQNDRDTPQRDALI